MSTDVVSSPGARRRLDPVSIGAVLGGLLVWEAAVQTGLVPTTLIAAPSSVAVALVNLLRESWFPRNVWVTLFETAAGFAIGSIVALILGVALGLQRIVYDVINAYVVAFQVVPKIVLAPIFITWFGFGLESKMVMAAAIAFFPVFVNTLLGLNRDIEQPVLLLRSLEASPWQVFWKARWPAALPSIFAGLEGSIGLAQVGAVIGEFINAQEGLGSLLLTFTHQYQIASAFAMLFLLAVIGYALYYLVHAIGGRVAFWR